IDNKKFRILIFFDRFFFKRGNSKKAKKSPKPKCMARAGTSINTPKKGKILLKDGKVIGEHQGFYYYTIGQRKGLHLSSGPYFVLKINPKNNTLIVSRDEKDLYKKELKAKRINWLNKPKLPIKVTAKIRYRHKGAKAKLYSGGRLVFEKPQMAIAPGQSVVFYKGEELLGGGIIELVATSA
ncbi:MAG TPA: tRNA methyl transferase PRC-barrel domain-containing protein, partial [Candidatus Parcubacteria bacterium]|nr:tRNA methyl transferase PRC-barrel domain-containing protein [Candidatus Parcubacteria bacterium]